MKLLLSYGALFTVIAADPAVEFAEHTVYAVAGSTVQLVATVHSSDLEAVVVRWYHDGALIDTSTKTAYGIGRIGSNMYALSVVEVGRGDLGRYVVLVCVGERNDSDTVQLVFPGVSINSMYVLACRTSIYYYNTHVGQNNDLGMSSCIIHEFMRPL